MRGAARRAAGHLDHHRHAGSLPGLASGWRRTQRRNLIDGELAGGLYGINLGRMFYGESMFTRSTDASKIARPTWCGTLTAQGVALIDCQQQTRHLASPAPARSRVRSSCNTRAATAQPSLAWTPGWLDSAGMLHPLARKDEPESPLKR